MINSASNDDGDSEGYLVIGSTGSEAVQGGFALRVSHTCKDLLPTLGTHLPHSGQVLSLHALHQGYLHIIKAGTCLTIVTQSFAGLTEGTRQMSPRSGDRLCLL